VTTRGCPDTLLSFQIFLISRARFSYFVIFSASILERLWVKGTVMSITSAVVFSLSKDTVSDVPKPTILSDILHLIFIIIIIIITLFYHPPLQYFKFTLRIFSEAVIYKSFINVCDVTESMIIGLPMETKTTDGGYQIFPLNFQLQSHCSYLKKSVLHWAGQSDFPRDFVKPR